MAAVNNFYYSGSNGIQQLFWGSDNRVWGLSQSFSDSNPVAMTTAGVFTSYAVGAGPYSLTGWFTGDGAGHWWADTYQYGGNDAVYEADNTGTFTFVGREGTSNSIAGTLFHISGPILWGAWGIGAGISIVSYNTGSNTQTTYSTIAPDYNNTRFILGPNGNAWYGAVTGNVVQVNVGTGATTSYPVSSYGILDLAFDGANLWLFDGHQVFVVDNSGAVIHTYSPLLGAVNGNICYSQANNCIYLTQSVTNGGPSLTQFTLGGAQHILANSLYPLVPGIGIGDYKDANPLSMIFGGDGKIYIGVQEIDFNSPSTTFQGNIVQVTPPQASPGGITFDGTTVIVGHTFDGYGAAYRINPADASSETPLFTTITGVGLDFFTAVDKLGNVYSNGAASGEMMTDVIQPNLTTVSAPTATPWFTWSASSNGAPFIQGAALGPNMSSVMITAGNTPTVTEFVQVQSDGTIARTFIDSFLNDLGNNWGIVFDGETAYTVLNSTLYLLHQNGIVEGIPLPHDAGQGLAYDGRYVWTGLTDGTGLLQFDTYTQATQTFTAVGPITAYVSMNIKFFAGYLWILSNGSIGSPTNYMYKVDPNNPTAHTDINHWSGAPGGIAYDGIYIWVLTDDGHIVSVVPNVPTSFASHAIPGWVTGTSNGIVYDGEFLYFGNENNGFYCDPAVPTVIHPLPVHFGASPFIDHLGYVWVADSTSNIRTNRPTAALQNLAGTPNKAIPGQLPVATVQTVSVVAGASSITVPDPSLIQVGMAVWGDGIYSNTTVTGITAGTISLSQNTNATTGGSYAYFSPFPYGTVVVEASPRRVILSNPAIVSLSKGATLQLVGTTALLLSGIPNVTVPTESLFTFGGSCTDTTGTPGGTTTTPSSVGAGILRFAAPNSIVVGTGSTLETVYPIGSPQANADGSHSLPILEPTQFEHATTEPVTFNDFPPNPSVGDVMHDPVTNTFKMYDGNTWRTARVNSVQAHYAVKVST